MLRYVPNQFEKKWAEKWVKDETYRPRKSDKNHPKTYTLSMFPYPSGSGLHVGHVRIYTGTDVLARYYRMNGLAVLQPMGWDAFGLPAENAAIKEHKNPMDMVPNNIANFKRQMINLGFSYDWSREFSTADPDYYRWTQWLFIQFFKMGLLYKKLTPVYFCEYCQTGLAEEEVLADGTHERCGKVITRKELPQWLFKITAYADRLLSDLKGLNWPEGILEMQKNWIGRKEGVEVDFLVRDPYLKIDKIRVFTTRLDTIFGVTFLVVSPETVRAWQEAGVKVEAKVKAYIDESLHKTNIQRLEEAEVKTGVFTGFYAVNPINNQKVPIWVADYVLADVGTGAVMGVPAHDQRDFDFARTYNLEIVDVVTGNTPVEGRATEEYGILINSGPFNGLKSKEAIEKIYQDLKKRGLAEKKVTYHLKDWVFSRQRYWGEPIPMINCEKCGWVPVPESELPLKLPYVKSYQPTKTGESPLANIPSFINTKCPTCGGKAKRETDTMPNWAGSCWYFLAFPAWNQDARYRDFESTSPPKGGSPKSLIQNQASSHPSTENWNLKIENYVKEWLPVDWYLGGAEHAVLHLLYSRFWVKALYDLKLLGFSEPFTRLRNVGIVLAADHRKMSKSLGNIVNPDDVIAEYGADTLRIYEMFMAPFNQEIAWSTNALQGGYRFLVRVWKLFDEFNVKRSTLNIKENKDLVVKLNKTIKKVTEDIAGLKFNTAIASMMEFLNEWERTLNVKPASPAGGHETLNIEQAKDFLKILAPFAPFIAEEIWQEVMGEKSSIHLSTWPKVEAEALIEEEVIIPVQVGGRLRGTITLSTSDLSKATAVKKALSEEKIKKYLEGKKYKEVYVEGKILNFVLL